MDSVWLLWHSHPTGADEMNEKLIGAYSNEEEAQLAKQRLAGKPGFSAYPQGFEIDKCCIGEDHWTEGYFTE